MKRPFFGPLVLVIGVLVVVGIGACLTTGGEDEGESAPSTRSLVDALCFSVVPLVLAESEPTKVDPRCEATATALETQLADLSVDVLTPPPSDPGGTRDLDFPFAFPPFNSGQGDCHDPQFALISYPDVGRVYRDGEQLTVQVQYRAPGCSTIGGTFGGRHIDGSPWYEHFCTDDQFGSSPGLGVCDGYFGSNIPAGSQAISGDEGIVTLEAQPGSFPPAGLDAVPNLEGFQICSIVISVTDGKPEGSRSSQQLDVACPEGWDTG